MASDRAVALALATLAEAFPTRETTERTANVWKKILEGVPDEALERAALKLCRDPDRRFFPSSGELFAAIAADAPPVDVLQVIHRIEKLGYYDPKLGWVYPTSQQIREKLGDAIADAYIVAGQEKVFAPEAADGNTITREIARQRFGARLDEAQRVSAGRQILPPAPSPEVLPAIEAPKIREPRQLLPGQKSPIAGTVSKVMREIEEEQITA